MKIVCDRHIPFLVEAVREHWPDVRIYPMEAEEIDSSAVRDADVLIVRTRTRVDSRLLEGSRVRLVCTATIGFDHIDTAYCHARGIRWMSCPGCNAAAVCDYVEEALDEYILSSLTPLPSPLTVGVVGVGHVGSLVARMAQRRGYNVLLNDPPKHVGVPLGSIAQKCDVITFHVPLTHGGMYPTFHLCDEAFLSRCRPGALIINAARGGVVDEQALLRSEHPFILDCWESEPAINPLVLQRAFRASMHIAGYSLRGKINASQMCLDAIARFANLPLVSLDSDAVALPPHGDSEPGWLMRITQRLQSDPSAFELLRQNYPLR